MAVGTIPALDISWYRSDFSSGVVTVFVEEIKVYSIIRNDAPEDNNIIKSFATYEDACAELQKIQNTIIVDCPEIIDKLSVVRG